MDITPPRRGGFRLLREAGRGWPPSGADDLKPPLSHWRESGRFIGRKSHQREPFRWGSLWTPSQTTQRRGPRPPPLETSPGDWTGDALPLRRDGGRESKVASACVYPAIQNVEVQIWEEICNTLSFYSRPTGAYLGGNLLLGQRLPLRGAVSVS